MHTWGEEEEESLPYARRRAWGDEEEEVRGEREKERECVLVCDRERERKSLHVFFF